MVDLIEQLRSRTLDSSRVNFDWGHANDRSLERDIPMETVKKSMFHGKMLSCRLTNSRENKYRSVFESPLKGRGNLIICFKILNGCINITTVIEDKLTAPKGRRNYLEYPRMSDDFELQEKILKNARYL